MIKPRVRRAASCAAATVLAAGTVLGGAAVASAHAKHRHRPVNVRPAAEAALLRMDVAYDAYTGEFYSDQVPLGARQQAAHKLIGELSRTFGSLSKLKLPSSASSQAHQFINATLTVAGTLKSLTSAPDTATFDSYLKTLTSQANAWGNVENAFRIKLGLPKYTAQRWFAAQPAGKLVYRDSLAKPDSTSNWHPDANANFADGGFVVAAPAGDQTVHGPSSPYNYDGRWISVAVDATPLSGSPMFGLGCPRNPSSNDSQLIGMVTTGGAWFLAVDVMPGHDNPPGYTGVGGSSGAISTTGVNHLRLDCEQFAPGLAIARLYDNGAYLGYLDAPINLAPATEPSLLDMSAPGASANATLFQNWSVSGLPH